jgi:succinate dehydrogenase/fumarate reductase flavoprotein subunit
MLTKAYNSIVVGAGGAGIAAVGALLHFHQSSRIAWIDPDFSGGRISKRYRDVSR